MTSASFQKTNPSLQKKAAARMAAVQALYRQAMTEEAGNPAAQVKALKAQLKDNRSEQKLLVGAPVEPDYALLERLLAGVATHREAINTVIDGTLKDGWTRERMSPLLVGVLQCGVFEMFHDKGLISNIVIDTYTRLARHFFADDEVDFVHGVLSALGKQRHG